MVMHLRTQAPNWDKARCKGMGPKRGDKEDIFFDDEELALSICNTGSKTKPGPCPIREECLLFALVNNNAHGVWGGLPEYDRRMLRKHRKKTEWAWHEPTPPELREDQNQPDS